MGTRIEEIETETKNQEQQKQERNEGEERCGRGGRKHGVVEMRYIGIEILGCYKSFPKEATTRAAKPLQLIHIDVCGPINPSSFGKNKYVLFFIDDYSRKI